MTDNNKDGIRCPHCNCGLSKVTNSYRVNWRGQTIIRRRRQCRHCGLGFFTKELPEEAIEPKPKPQPPPEQGDGQPENPYL